MQILLKEFVRNASIIVCYVMQTVACLYLKGFIMTIVLPQLRYLSVKLKFHFVKVVTKMRLLMLYVNLVNSKDLLLYF